MPRVKTDENAAPMADAVSTAASEPPTITKADIARHAYDLYLARGCKHGHAIEDWVQAERDLRGVSHP